MGGFGASATRRVWCVTAGLWRCVLGGVSPAQAIDASADIDRWRARAEQAEAVAARLRQENAGLNARVASLAAEVERLQETVTTLSGLLFGSSSEKRAPAAGGSRAGAGEDGAGGHRPHGACKRGQRPGAPGHGRRGYAHLETKEHIIDLEEQQRCCPRCGTGYEFIGTEDSEQIDWRVTLIRILLRRRRCRRRCTCAGPETICAPPAPKVVPEGLFTAGFLARLLHEKYVLGRPVHRIVSALAAEGLEIASGTLIGELRQIAPLLASWAQAIAGHGRQAGQVHCDETSWQVFEDVADKENHRWWLWVFVTLDTTVSVMDPSRSAQVAADELGIDRTQTALEAGRRLVISSGFHKAYQSLARIDGVDAIWCFAHIRRYFLRAGAAHPDQLGDWCAAWTERIAVLYRARHALAAAIPGTGAHEQARQRYQRAFTDLDAARILQTQSAARGLLHPAAAKVIATLTSEWDGLVRHQDLPQLPLDNYADAAVMPMFAVGGGSAAGQGGALAG